MPAATTPEAERARREKIRVAMTGRKLSDETRRRMSESAIFRTMETRARITPDISDLEDRALG